MDKKHKYVGGWSVNNGSTYNDGYYDNNLSRLCRDMRAIAKGNVPAGSNGRWAVYSTDDINEPIKSGRV